MKPHPRIRKTIKWGGAAVTLLLVVVWIGSGWWETSELHLPVVTFAIDRGRLYIHSSDFIDFPRDWPGGSWPRGEFVRSFDLDWRPECFGGSARWWGVMIPLWMIFALTSLATLVAWRFETLARRRARRLNLCPKCDYDRAGLVGGAAGAVCPECGSGSGGAGGASVTKPT
jgi:hypothetical protein